MKISIYQPHFIHHFGQRKDSDGKPHQEDSLFPDENLATTETRLFLVCDGMGGHSKGEVASQTVCQAFDEYFSKYADYNQVVGDEVLKGALAYAYTLLDERDDGAFKKMGTTLTLVCFHKGGVTMAHAGDSRVYHIRPGEEKPLYQSRDHSLVYDMYQAGDITYEEMKTDRRKNYITRALMPGEENRVEMAIAHTTDVVPGDYFYLCSDGMLEEMENDELVQLLSADVSDEEKINQLLQATENNNDNHTAYLIRVENVVPEAGDRAMLHDEDTTKANAINLVPITFEDTSEVTPGNPVEANTVDVEQPVNDTPPVQQVPQQNTVQPQAPIQPQVQPIPQPQVQPQVQQQVPPQPQPQMPPQQNQGVPAPGYQPNNMPMPAKPAKYGFLVWIFIICLALLVGGAVYYFLNGGKESETQQPAQPTQTETEGTTTTDPSTSAPSFDADDIDEPDETYEDTRVQSPSPATRTQSAPRQTPAQTSTSRPNKPTTSSQASSNRPNKPSLSSQPSPSNGNPAGRSAASSGNNNGGTQATPSAGRQTTTTPSSGASSSSSSSPAGTSSSSERPDL